MNKVEQLLKVTLPDKREVTIGRGTKVLEVVNKYITQDAVYPIMACKVSNKLHSLNYALTTDCDLTFVTYKDREGVDVYRRTLSAILARAVIELRANTRLVVMHSMGNAYYYDYYTDILVNDSVLDVIDRKMREIIEKDDPIKRQVMSIPEAMAFFNETGNTDKGRLLKHTELDKIAVYTCGKFTDIGHGPLLPSTGYTKTFRLKTYHNGFILMFPEQADMKIHCKIKSHKKLFKVYHEAKKLSKLIAVNNVGRFNQIMEEENSKEIILTAEALHEKKIAAIAEEIMRKPEVRLILIAGPSSSGKTTFAKRLSLQLMASGLRPVALSLDDYFVNREDNPIDADGNYDFEVIEALDVPLFNKHLPLLLAGEEVAIPGFDFHDGKRKDSGHSLNLDDDQILIVEGIHGLNEKLTYSVPSHQKTKIYISPLTQLSIDDYNRIPTTDARLIRRMVRDQKYRGHSARETLDLWIRVRRGEERNIFPFQDEADFMFNSALSYELAVLKPFAYPLLSKIPREDPMYNEARRLMRFLAYFRTLPTDDIPRTSLLREFVGGSLFSY
jgi:uridine kinase